ncbi:hypothetical protein ACIQOV_22990, partial [Kitasatospora sp. NPDC091257]|uniref:hypothetical protein n=1 Tax=Kitasatospora sp. NPDC091257 TaxID=3364084 RepID=UPI0037F77FB8
MSETVFETESDGPELRPYPKIPARGRSGGPGSREWTAAEKVHGAHFAVVCEGGSVRAAKRRELLDDEGLDAFFGVSRIWPELSVAAARFAAAVRGTRDGAAVRGTRDGAAVRGDGAAAVTIYGELAGGRYPH